MMNKSIGASFLAILGAIILGKSPSDATEFLSLSSDNADEHGRFLD
jgi:hypothetical protein